MTLLRNWRIPGTETRQEDNYYKRTRQDGPLPPSKTDRLQSCGNTMRVFCTRGARISARAGEKLFFIRTGPTAVYIGKWKEGVSGKRAFLREGMGVLCAGARQAAGSGHERKPGRQFVFFYCNKTIKVKDVR